jgi:hypothetical protein
VGYNNVKILLCEITVKGKIARENCLGFQAKIEDLNLKSSILGDDNKNKSSGIKS